MAFFLLSSILTFLINYNNADLRDLDKSSSNFVYFKQLVLNRYEFSKWIWILWPSGQVLTNESTHITSSKKRYTHILLNRFFFNRIEFKHLTNLRTQLCIHSTSTNLSFSHRIASNCYYEMICMKCGDTKSLDGRRLNWTVSCGFLCVLLIRFHKNLISTIVCTNHKHSQK